MTVKVLVLRSPGTNCDEETAFAFEEAGRRAGIAVQAQRVHVNRFVDKTRALDEFQIAVLPGGFSFGDDLGSGKVLANKIVFSFEKEFAKFIEQGNLVLGICNGFQVLVKARLLPGFQAIDQQQFSTLTFNDSAKFEDRWVNLKTQKSPCIFSKGIGSLEVPVRHGEGKFVVKAEEVLRKLEKNRQIVFTYESPKGEENPPYPFNPNGSVSSIAGICNPQGNVLGLMPHPECFNNPLNHPRWARGEALKGGEGLKIFENAVIHANEKLI